MTAHYNAVSAYVRGRSGSVQTRSASLRLRLEPALLEALKLRAEQTGDRWPDGRGAGASAYVRALIVADLKAAGLLVRDGGSVLPAGELECGNTSTAAGGVDRCERSRAEQVVAMLAEQAERDPVVRGALADLDQRWAEQGV